MMKKISFFPFLLSFCLSGHAQFVDNGNYPIIGKPCPDFVLRNIRYYSKQQATLSDFRGKWLVLDFWNTHCGACVASFPRVSAMQKEFGDKVQYMMVGIEDKEKEIEPMYAKFRERENLVMPCAFDSLLANRWDVGACPHVIILDEKGVVRAITSSYHREDMQGFLSGNPPHLKAILYDGEEDHRIALDKKRPFLINGNGGNDSAFLFRSLLSSYKADEQQGYFPETISEDSAKGRFQVMGLPLDNLYNFAYYGTIWPRDTGCHAYPVLEIKDSTPFRYNSYTMFCYSLTLPAAQSTTERMKRVMQKDLEVYFGYDAKMEERKFPYWRLVATKEAKKRLAAKGGKDYFQAPPHTGITVRNFPFSNLLSFIVPACPDPIKDETGIQGNVDISLNWIDTDFESVKNALHANGLDLVREEKQMKVLVIKDKENSSN